MLTVTLFKSLCAECIEFKFLTFDLRAFWSSFLICVDIPQTWPRMLVSLASFWYAPSPEDAD